MTAKAINDIKVKRDRCRKDMGDIDSLAASIEHLGQLQPIGIRPDGTLICGQRRLKALKHLGRDKVEVHICRDMKDELEFLEAERDENTCRLALTPFEAHGLAEKLTPKYKEVAKKAKEEGRKKGGKTAGKGRPKTDSSGGTSPKANRDETKRARNLAAASTGYDEKTMRKVAQIKDAAKEDPALQPIANKLKAHGAKVDAVHKEVTKAVTAKKDVKAARTATRAIRKNADANGVFHGDSFELASTIPDSSCALIFTDPPYDKKSLPMFDQLSELADRILVAGGSLITYCGQYSMPQVINSLEEHLKFYWPLCCLHTGQTAQMTLFGIKVKWKPMLWFVKGTGRRDTHTWVKDLVVSEQEKDAHPWQQSVIEAKYYIECLTQQDELVVDPFCGGGTTALAAKELQRQWWTADVDARHVETARSRLHDA